MNEWELAMLEMASRQNETLKNIERAVSELSREVMSMRATLEDAARRPNVIALHKRVQGVEGEVSELRGRVARHEADIGRMAAGRSNGR